MFGLNILTHAQPGTVEWVNTLRGNSLIPCFVCMCTSACGRQRDGQGNVVDCPFHPLWPVFSDA